MSNITHVRRREMKQCVQCGKQDSNTLKGRYRCLECTKKASKYERKYTKKRTPEQREAYNADKREWRQMLRKNHLCINCKQQDAFTLNGRPRCAECAAKEAERSQRRRTENPTYQPELAKRTRQQWIAEHKCSRCGRVLQKFYGYKTCPICRQGAKQRAQKYRWKKNPDHIIRGTPGYCTTCCKKPVLEGKKLCAECYEKALASIKKAQEAAWKTNDKHIWRTYSCKAVKRHTNPI